MPNEHANERAHQNAEKRAERKALKAIKKKVVTHLVEMDNAVQVDHAELLGYVEGLKFATAEKPMPVYNDDIRNQLIAEGLAAPGVRAEGQEDLVPNKNVFVYGTNEEARAAFEAEVRGLDFGE